MEWRRARDPSPRRYPTARSAVRPAAEATSQLVLFVRLCSLRFFVVNLLRSLVTFPIYSHQNLGAGRFAAPISASVLPSYRRPFSITMPIDSVLRMFSSGLRSRTMRSASLPCLERADVAVEAEIARAVDRRRAQRLHAASCRPAAASTAPSARRGPAAGRARRAARCRRRRRSASRPCAISTWLKSSSGAIEPAARARVDRPRAA